MTSLSLVGMEWSNRCDDLEEVTVEVISERLLLWHKAMHAYWHERGYSIWSVSPKQLWLLFYVNLKLNKPICFVTNHSVDSIPSHSLSQFVAPWGHAIKTISICVKKNETKLLKRWLIHLVSVCVEKGKEKKHLKGEEVQVHPGIKNRGCLAYIHRDIC